MRYPETKTQVGIDPSLLAFRSSCTLEKIRTIGTTAGNIIANIITNHITRKREATKNKKKKKQLKKKKKTTNKKKEDPKKTINFFPFPRGGEILFLFLGASLFLVMW